MSDCIFCRIANKEIPSDIVYESKDVVGFRDISPQAPVHILLIPKKHINPKVDVSKDEARVVSDIFLALRKVAEGEGVAKSGFRVISNVGEDAGQEVDHLHFHLLGGKKLGSMLAK